MGNTVTSMFVYGISILLILTDLGVAYLLWRMSIKERGDMSREFPGFNCPPLPPPPPKTESPAPISFGFHNIYKNQYGEEVLGRVAYTSHDYAKDNIDHSEQDRYTETVKVIRFKQCNTNEKD